MLNITPKIIFNNSRSSILSSLPDPNFYISNIIDISIYAFHETHNLVHIVLLLLKRFAVVGGHKKGNARISNNVQCF